MSLFNKLISFVVSLFNKSEKHTVPEQPATQDPPMLTPKPQGPTSELNDEPTETSLDAEVTSFLWKPVSDTSPMVTVITVSCDKARSEHLRIDIKGKNDIPLKIENTKNKYSTFRGNQLPNHKYGRINFKPGLTHQEFSKYTPLKISFYLEIAGVRTNIKVGGKDFIVIKEPKLRKDLIF